MGLMLDCSILIADERGRFDLTGFLRQFPGSQPVIAAVSASELLHGVERASDAARKARRKQHVERILASVFIQSFELTQARCHARIWADLESRGEMIGPHDLLIAATALSLGHEVGTLNVSEFRRVSGLTVADGTPCRRR
jgi:tRNA(fMet)-specific endonuclease VapC